MNGPRAERDLEAKRERAADGGDAGEKPPPVDLMDAAHGDLIPLTRRPAAA